jgi:O-antigen ligase
MYALARLAFSPSPEGLQNVAVYCSFVLAMAITCVQITAAGATIVARRMRYIAVLVSMLFLMSFLAGITIYGERAYALIGLIFMAILIPHRPRRIIYRTAPFLVAGIIALSLSRTATAIALVMLIFLSVRGKRGFRLVRSSVFAGLAAAAAYWLITYYAPFRDRFIGGDNAATIGNVELNTSGRSVLWNMTIRSAEANPLFGNGPGTATALISGAFKNISHPHNEYLRLFHDFGYVGAGLFVIGIAMLLAQTLKRALRADHPIHWAALLGLLAVVAAAFTDNVIIYPFVMVPLGVILGASAGLSGENALPKAPDLISTGP